MNIVEKPISELKPYPTNPKIHTEKQIEQIASSIKLTKGLRQPIVIDKDNFIVCGHGRYLAAQKLGYKTVPCELIDNLTDDEIRAYRLIDNRISEGEYDLSLEFEELSEIELDMGEFDFDLFSMDDIEEVSKSEKSTHEYYGDAVEATYKQINFRLYDAARTEGQYNMPVLKPVDYIPNHMIGFNYAKTSTDYDSTLHFYIDDYQFERLWNRPLEYLPLMAKFKACLTPNFSIYLDYPEAAKIWNTWRGRLLGQVMQDYGIITIPIVYWSTESSYDWAFDGLPENSTLSINDFNRQNKESRELWNNGVKELIRRKSPKRILLFGNGKEKKCDFDFGDIEVLYYQNESYKRIRGEN